jgi:hypothetical protein
MTTVGVSFRSWFVERDINELVPIHGTAGSAERTQYIDADSEDARVLDRTIALVKGQVPLKYVPVLPSQSLPSAMEEIASGFEDQSSKQPAYYADRAQGSTAAYVDNQVVESTTASYSGKAESSATA